MAREIERKFIVLNEVWRAQAGAPRQLVQGYLSRGENIVVRVRRDVDAQGFARGFITIKGKTEGIARDEYEYEVPEQEAAALLRLCEGYLVEKERYVCD